jgi:hypothetical protein
LASERACGAERTEAIVTRTISANKARQGRWGWHVLIILIAAMLLAFAVWGGVYFYGEAIDQTQGQALKG